MGILDLLLSVGLVASLFALMFRYMPSRRLPWRVVAAAAPVTARIIFGRRRS